MSRRYKIFRIICGVLALGVICAMWFFSSQNGDESGKLSGTVTRFILKVLNIEATGANLNKYGYMVRKAAHFNMFALFGLTSSLALSSYKKPPRALLALPIAIICAIADEFHQGYVAGRAGMWQDSLLDSSGALCGIAVAMLVLWVVKRVKIKRQEI